MEAAEATGKVAPSVGAEAAPALLPLPVVVLEDVHRGRGHLQPAKRSGGRSAPADSRRHCANPLVDRHIGDVLPGAERDLLQA
eukprot:4272038-Alexandrium_andersonii.AAC.1